MITLPDEGALSRGPLRAFWLATSLLAGGLASTLPWSRARRRVPLCAAAVAAVSVPGLVRPEMVRRPYLAWDRVSRRAADVATRHVTWVTHTTAVPARPTDEFRPRAHTDGTAWRATDSQPAEAYPRLSATLHEGRGHTCTERSLRQHLRDEGHPRRRWLLACLQVLHWLQDPDEPPRQPVDDGDNYTLY